MRVTDAQAATFAAYEKDGKVWYELDASLTAPREDTPEGMAEFEWLRDFAADLQDERKWSAALEAALREMVDAVERALDHNSESLTPVLVLMGTRERALAMLRGGR
jgi:hypothetical protein